MKVPSYFKGRRKGIKVATILTRVRRRGKKSWKNKIKINGGSSLRFVRIRMAG
jgi:hypothetical protein